MLYLSSVFVGRHPHTWPSSQIFQFSAWVNGRSDSSTAK